MPIATVPELLGPKRNLQDIKPSPHSVRVSLWGFGLKTVIEIDTSTVTSLQGSEIIEDINSEMI